MAIQRECFDRGLLLERGGREGATVRFLPPLVLTESEANDVADVFESGVAAALAE